MLQGVSTVVYTSQVKCFITSNECQCNFTTTSISNQSFSGERTNEYKITIDPRL